MQTMIGLFKTHDNVKRAVEAFRNEGFNTKDFSLVMKDEEKKHEDKDLRSYVTGGTATGALIGGIVGLVGAIAIPGLGSFLLAGQIASAFGMTGAAAATIAGATTGIVAGGLIGALTSLGLSKREAEHYEKEVRTGAILLAVPARKGEEGFVRHIFEHYGAYDLKSIEQPFTNSDMDDEAQDSFKNENFSKSQYQGHQMFMSGAKGGEAKIASEDHHPQSEIKVYARKGDVVHIEIDER